MITIVIGTNTHSPSCNAVCKVYADFLTEMGYTFQILNLHRDLPENFLHSSMYQVKHDEFNEFQQKFLFNTSKYILILPEYNAGIPGIFKLVIDASDIKEAWWHKKACLCGISAGRAGNLRGLDYLTNILNYLKVDVYKNKLPISKIHDYVREGELIDQNSKNLIKETLQKFFHF